MHMIKALEGGYTVMCSGLSIVELLGLCWAFLLVWHVLQSVLLFTLSEIVVCVRCARQRSMLCVQFWRAADCWWVRVPQNIIRLHRMWLNIWSSRLRVERPPPHCMLLACWRKSLPHFQNSSWRYTYICSLSVKIVWQICLSHVGLINKVY